MKIPEIIIYDFDGVICDSVNIKTDAFIELYRSYGKEIQSKVRTYHLENGGISRYQKFRFFESQILGKKVSESRINDLADRFSALVKKKVISSKYIPGAIEFISKNKNKRQFICTGTPENEILEIIREKRIDTYFERVYGSPSTKTSIIKTIINECNISLDEYLFFGDAMTDYYAARECKIKFVGVQNNINHSIFPKGTIVINNFL